MLNRTKKRRMAAAESYRVTNRILRARKYAQDVEYVWI